MTAMAVSDVGDGWGSASATATAAEKTLLSTIPTALVTMGAIAAAKSAAESAEERVYVPRPLM